MKKYDEDSNTTLVFVSFSYLQFIPVVTNWETKAGLFSAVSSTFVIEVQSKLEPVYDEANAAYMRFLIYSISNSAFATPPGLPTWNGPSEGIVVAANLLYASLVTSLLAAFVAILGKQWVNRYTRNKGGSTVERCGDCRRKLNGLHRWHFHVLMESLPVVLQLALSLLGCGLSQYMWVVKQTVASTIISVTGSGILFYIAIVVAGAISYECLFQTPLSLVFRAFGAHRAFSHLRAFLYASMNSVFSCLIALKSRATANIPPRSLDTPPLEHLLFSEGGLLKPDRMRFNRRRNLLNALCVSWTLDRITDPEVMNAALRQFMGIQWHAGVPPAALPNQLTALYRDCFDHRNALLPGSRDRAYASGRALVHLYVPTPIFLSICLRFSPVTRTRFPFHRSSLASRGAILSRDSIYLKACQHNISVGYPTFACVSIGCTRNNRYHPRSIPSPSHTKSSLSVERQNTCCLIVC